MRRPIPRAPRFPAKLGTLEIQRMILPKSGRGAAKALVRGWPTPIPMTARTELPPLPRKPVYGPAARKEALWLMREAKREKINFGWSTKTNLCRMANGERPLSYSVWEGAQKYVRQVAGSGSTSRMYRNGLCRSASLPARVPARVAARLTDVSPRPRRQERIVDINAIRRRSPDLGLAHPPARAGDPRGRSVPPCPHRRRGLQTRRALRPLRRVHPDVRDG